MQERTRERDRVWNCSLDLIAVTTRDGFFARSIRLGPRCSGMRRDSLLDHSFTEFVHSEDRSAAMKALGAEAAVEHLDLRLPTPRVAGAAWNGPWCPKAKLFMPRVET